MAADVVAALADALRVPAPRTPGEAAAAFGDERQQNAAMAELLVGPMPEGASPDSRAEWRRRRKSTMRELQRFRAAEGRQKRRPGREYQSRLRRVYAAAQRVFQQWRYRDARRRGFNMRVIGEIRVSRTVHVATMPANVAGRAVYAHIPPLLAAPVVDRWVEGAHDEAGAELLRAFFAVYWPDDAEAVTYLTASRSVFVYVAGEEP